MNLQNYLLCILYILLFIAHSYTLSRKDFHRGLISIFSFALLTQTISTVLFTLHQTVLIYGQQLTDISDIDFSPIYNVHYFAQLIHVTSINFFILFLLIVAKGWPITRRDMPFKYTFTIFWLLCLAADLITFYWTTITMLANNFTNNYNDPMKSLSTTSTAAPAINLTYPTISTASSLNANISDLTTFKTPTSIIESLPSDTEQFNSTPRRLSLLLRVVIMLYFLLELRTTMILEQEQKKLQFYLHFGALSMVWFVHSVIVYVISLRVEIVWQSKLISGFSSAANFLAFAITTRLLWPQSSKSYLFKKHKRSHTRSLGENNLDNLSTVNTEDEDDDYNNNDNDYDGLEMRDLNRNRKMTHNNRTWESVMLDGDREIPTIRVESHLQTVTETVENN